MIDYPSALLMSIVLIVGVARFFIGRSSVPEKTLTLTKTVEVPVYESAMLADTSEVFLYDVPLSDSLQRYIYEIYAERDKALKRKATLARKEKQLSGQLCDADV